MSCIIISFKTKHEDYTDQGHNEAIVRYREWIEQYGKDGRLFMWDINKVKTPDGSVQSRITGIKFFKQDIAVLFKLMFDV